MRVKNKYKHKTVIAIAIVSTFVPSVAEEVGAAIAAEACTSGITKIPAPNFDLARDPRWGRTKPLAKMCILPRKWPFICLVKNDHQLLPFRASARKIAVLGPGSSVQ